MSMINPKGRVNYAPNSWGGAKVDRANPPKPDSTRFLPKKKVAKFVSARRASPITTVRRGSFTSAKVNRSKGTLPMRWSLS